VQILGRYFNVSINLLLTVVKVVPERQKARNWSYVIWRL